MKYLALALLVMVCGCTERAKQKNWGVGGDPALATQKDVQDMKKTFAMKSDVEELKKLINDRFDRLEGNAHGSQKSH